MAFHVVLPDVINAALFTDPDEDGPVGVDELGELVFPSQMCGRDIVAHIPAPVPGWREDYDVPVFYTAAVQRWTTLTDDGQVI